MNIDASLHSCFMCQTQVETPYLTGHYKGSDLELREVENPEWAS